jgi:23S rRNA pseudouridine1911/1915/1917 synthase
LGNPIVGDKLYGDKIKDRRLKTRVERQLLHAVEITFPHPTSGKMVSFAAPPPEDIIYIS